MISLASGRVPKAHGYTLSAALNASLEKRFLEQAAQAAGEDGGEGAAGIFLGHENLLPLKMQ